MKDVMSGNPDRAAHACLSRLRILLQTPLTVPCPSLSDTVRHYTDVFFVKLFMQLFPFQVADGGFGSTGVMAVMEGVKVRNALPYRYLLIRIWKRLSQNCLELYRISDQRAQLLNTDPDDAKCCPLSIILPRLLSESSS